MKKYIGKRLAFTLLVLFGVCTLTFFVSRVIPGDPAAMWAGSKPTQEQLEAARKELGLDRPLWVQYLDYMGNLLKGDLGVSIRSKQPVLEEVGRSVGQARGYCDDVEFSAEDATRSDPDFLVQVFLFHQ